MKIKNPYLEKIIQKSLEDFLNEQMELNLPAPVEIPDKTMVNDDLFNVENLFNYIREQINVGNFTMAKRFVDNLKTQIEKMEQKTFSVIPEQ